MAKESKIMFSYIESLRPPWAMWDPVSKNKTRGCDVAQCIEYLPSMHRKPWIQCLEPRKPWLCKPLIPELRKRRQQDRKFKVILCYLENERSGFPTGNPVSINNRMKRFKRLRCRLEHTRNRPHVRLKVRRLRPERETAKESQGDRAGRPGEKAVRQEEEQELGAGAGEVARCWRALDALVHSVISVF